MHWKIPCILAWSSQHLNFDFNSYLFPMDEENMDAHMYSNAFNNIASLFNYHTLCLELRGSYCSQLQQIILPNFVPVSRYQFPTM